jgi:DNA replication protein DnaD
MEPMKSKNFRLTKPQLEDLEKLSKERGIKESEIVRRALEEFFARLRASQ